MKYPTKLINKLLSVDINNQIDISDLIIKKNLNISIENFKLELTELKINKICISCTRKGIYTDNINNYCWIHCQII